MSPAHLTETGPATLANQGRGARAGNRQGGVPPRVGQSTSFSVPFISAKWPGKEQK
jgi:hypothetical protein